MVMKRLDIGDTVTFFRGNTQLDGVVEDFVYDDMGARVSAVLSLPDGSEVEIAEYEGPSQSYH